jgi:hypothetical protein
VTSYDQSTLDKKQRIRRQRYRRRMARIATAMGTAALIVFLLTVL